MSAREKAPPGEQITGQGDGPALYRSPRNVTPAGRYTVHIRGTVPENAIQRIAEAHAAAILDACSHSGSGQSDSTC